MNTAPMFDESIVGHRLSTLQFDKWDSVVDSFEEKKYKESILGLLDYIDSTIIKKRGNKEKTEFTIPHGSLKVHFTINDKEISLDAKFLKLPQKNYLPMLRQITEINFSVLNLTKIVLHGDELFFEMKSPIELCEPYKLYYIFSEVCTNADYYDDFFIEKFGATRLQEMEVEPFAKKDLDFAWDRYQAYLKEGLQSADYYMEKRLSGFAWDAFCTTLMKIDYVMAPQGYLISDIKKTHGELYGDSSIEEKIIATRKSITKLLEYSKEKFSESMYIPSFFHFSTSKVHCSKCSRWI